MTATGDLARRIVAGRHNGLDQITGTHPGTEYSHRLSAGRGGPVTAANGVRVHGLTHRALHRAPQAAYAAGWWVRSEADPLLVPALIRTDLAPHGAWTVLDDLARLAEPAEVAAAGLDPELTLEVAVAQLRAEARWAA